MFSKNDRYLEAFKIIIPALTILGYLVFYSIKKFADDFDLIYIPIGICILNLVFIALVCYGIWIKKTIMKAVNWQWVILNLILNILFLFMETAVIE